MLRDMNNVDDLYKAQELIREEFRKLEFKYNSMFGITQVYPEIVYNSLKRFLQGRPAHIGTLKRYYRILQKEGLCKNK